MYVRKNVYLNEVNVNQETLPALLIAAMTVIFLFAVFAAIDRPLRICQDEYLIQSLFNGCT